MNYVIDFLINAIALGMTFLYGSTGEIITEKVGHLNLGIPGIMCVGAAGGCAMVQTLVLAGNVPGALIVVLGLLAAFLSAGLMGLLYSALTVSFKANQNVTGLTMTIFGVGVMRFIMSGLGQENHAYLKALPIFRLPFSDLLPGTAWQYLGIMVYLAIAIAIAASLVLTKTKVGLHLRAVGENPATADAVGINVNAYKYGATIIGSGIAGLGGLFYIMNYAGSPEAYKSIETLGWLSIALVIFALWRPHLSIFGSALFGALYLAGSYIPSIPAFQALGLPMSFTQLLKMLPYVVTVIVLTIDCAESTILLYLHIVVLIGSINACFYIHVFSKGFLLMVAYHSLCRFIRVESPLRFESHGNLLCINTTVKVVVMICNFIKHKLKVVSFCLFCFKRIRLNDKKCIVIRCSNLHSFPCKQVMVYMPTPFCHDNRNSTMSHIKSVYHTNNRAVGVV